jgi:2-polyprenyl-6-hydroxyphenyl methylase/3-demethylubiquinone-9 3-methyltransferase
MTAHLRKTTVADWDREWRAGKWEYLCDSVQRSRYFVIAALATAYVARPRLLDLGCGSGHLVQALGGETCIQRYVGVDISREAINQASHRVSPSIEFQVGDLATYVPNERFDCVVLNEVLYYLPAPERILANLLQLDNVRKSYYVVSIFQEQKWVWSVLNDHLAALEEVYICHPRTGKAWAIALMKAIDPINGQHR